MVTPVEPKPEAVDLREVRVKGRCLLGQVVIECNSRTLTFYKSFFTGRSLQGFYKFFYKSLSTLFT